MNDQLPRKFLQSITVMMLLTVLFLFSSTGFAAVELMYLRTPNHPEVIVIPKRTEESAAQAIQAFQRSVAQSKALSPYYQNVKSLIDSEVSYQLPNEYHGIIVANSAEDLSNSPARLSLVIEPLKTTDLKNQMKAAMIPIGASLRLQPSEREEFHSKLANRFPLLMPKGGDDVHPLYFGERITHSLNTNSVRDFLELRLIRDYYKFGNGIIFGICRGSQIVNVAFGNKLAQDVVEDGLTGHTHRGGVEHDFNILKTKDTFFLEALGTNSYQINSYHHQAVKANSNSLIEIAGVSPDGIAEAFSSVDGRLQLMQFHPERAPTLESSGRLIYKALIFKVNSINSCSKLRF